MFFGMFGTPIFFIIPLVFIFVVARAISGFIRGAGRPTQRNLPENLGLPAQMYRKDPRGLIRGRNSDESRIFKLALRLKGRLTVSDVVIETGLNLHEAEDLVESIVDNVHVRMEVDDQGHVTYEFPEIIRRLEGEGPFTA